MARSMEVVLRDMIGNMALQIAQIEVENEVLKEELKRVKVEATPIENPEVVT